MNIITISREFGSGGRELGKRLADVLDYAYYDREIITEISKQLQMDEKYIERVFNDGFRRSIPLRFGQTFQMNKTMQSISTELLIAQKKVILQLAASGKDMIIVGRNADVILKDRSPLNLFVYADIYSKIRRCRERQNSALSDQKIMNEMREIDSKRAKARELIGGSKWSDQSNYAFTINTTSWNIKELAPAIAHLATCWFERTT